MILLLHNIDARTRGKEGRAGKLVLPLLPLLGRMCAGIPQQDPGPLFRLSTVLVSTNLVGAPTKSNPEDVKSNPARAQPQRK